MSIRATRKGIFVSSSTRGWCKIYPHSPSLEIPGALPDCPPRAGSLKSPSQPRAASAGGFKVAHDDTELFVPHGLRFLFSSEQAGRESFPSELVASCLAVLSVAVAVGNGGVLVNDHMFSAPVNASLGFVLLDETKGSAQVVSAFMQTLGEIQDRRLSHLTDEGFKRIEQRIADIQRERDSYFGNSKYRSPNIEADFLAQIKSLRRLLRPLLLVRNPRAGTLSQAALTSGGSGLLATYLRDEVSCRLLDGSAGSCRDLELLNAAWNNQTPDPITISRRQWFTVRPMVTVLFSGSRSPVIGILCSEEPSVRELAERLVFLQGTSLTRNPNTVSIPKAFRETVSRLVAARDGTATRRLGLSRRAATALMEFSREVERYRRERGRWFGEPVMLAAKIALIIHVSCDHQGNLICVDVMREGVTLARQFNELSFKLAQELVLRTGSHKGGQTV